MGNILDYKAEDPGPKLDLSGIVTHECPCGSDLWKIVVRFTNYEIGMYFLDMECFACGTRATAPTPLDNIEEEYDGNM